MSVSPTLSNTITQAAHSLVVGNVVYLNGGSYTLAIASSQAAAEVIGIVTAVANVNTFTLTFGGLCTGLLALIPGTVYFLSDITAGALTATVTTTSGNISKPVLVANSTVSGYFINYRGKILP